MKYQKLFTQKNMKNKKAFTLVELMVVIAIIALLAVGSITGYSSYLKKARDSERVIIANKLLTDFELAFDKWKEVPELFVDDWNTGGYVYGELLVDETYINSTVTKIGAITTPSDFLSTQNLQYPYIETPTALKGITFSHIEDSVITNFDIQFFFETQESCSKLKLKERFKGKFTSPGTKDEASGNEYLCQLAFT